MEKQRKYLMICIIVVIIIVILILIFSKTNYSTKVLNYNEIEKDNVLQDKVEITNEINNEVNNEINNNVATNNINNALSENITKENIKYNDANMQEEIEENLQNEGNVETKKWGNNVAFIGDSRTQGFLMYTGQKDVVDYTYIGLMVDTAITKEFVKTSNGDKVTILEDMKNKDIDTVYIMLGVNELGWAYSNVFINKYEELIDKIKEIKPNSKIYLQSIIPVTKEKSERDDIYNNVRIKEYNSLIKKLADKKGIKYLDISGALADKEGNLPKSASTDGIHINKEYCKKWLKYIQENS